MTDTKGYHCIGCTGWVSYSTHDEGYECPGFSVAHRTNTETAIVNLIDAASFYSGWVKGLGIEVGGPSLDAAIENMIRALPPRVTLPTQRGQQ